VAVLGYAYWRDRLAGDAAALNRTIRIGTIPFTICGVAAPEFSGLAPGSAPALYIPIGTRPRIVSDSISTAGQRTSMFTDAHYYWTDMIGRLRPGISLARAEVGTRERFRQFVIGAGANASRTDFPSLWLEEGGAGLDSLRRQYAKPLWILMSMVAFILAIACANIANLLLARAAARQREMAVRLSLGASRARIVRQLLTESLLLAVPGGLLGLGVAAAGSRFLIWLLAGGGSSLQLRPAFDWRILAFVTGLSIGTALLFGLAPAFEATRINIAPSLKGTRINQERSRGPGIQRLLVIAQIALSSLLVLGAVVFVRTLGNLHSIDLGFEAKNILVFNLNASKSGYKGAELNALYHRVEDRLRSLSGVSSVAATAAPLGRRFYRTPVLFHGKPIGHAGWNAVSPSFFETMRIPIVAGRSLSVRDGKGAPPVAVVNDAFAKAYFPGRDPVGEHVQILDGGKDVTIVGVAANARESLKDPFSPFVYIAYPQFPAPEWRGMFFELRTTGDPLALSAGIQRALRSATPDVPVANVTTLAERIESAFTQERAFAHLCAAFAVLALAIACIGLYGSMAYAVSRRTGEIGIRMALGAQRSGVVRMMMREVLILTASGLALGFISARSLAPAVESFLFGVRLGDPAVIGWGAGLMVVTALVAGYAPARRASQVDPMTALRHE